MTPFDVALWLAVQAAGSDDLLTFAERAATLSGPAVVVVVLVLVVRGTLVPRRHVDEVVELAAQRIATADTDRDWWREVGVQALNVGEAAVGRGNR